MHNLPYILYAFGLGVAVGMAIMWVYRAYKEMS